MSDKLAQTRDLLDLTPAQFEALVMFMSCRDRVGVCPTYDELGVALGIAKSSARTRVQHLVKKGYLKSVGARRGWIVTNKVELLA